MVNRLYLQYNNDSSSLSFSKNFALQAAAKAPPLVVLLATRQGCALFPQPGVVYP
jgi:hypothetical protein